MRYAGQIWIVLVLSSFALVAVTNIEGLAQTKYVYCEISAMEKLMSKKVTVIIDFGEKMKYFADNRMKDEKTGKPIVFNTKIDALNFMGKQGWDFVQAYAVSYEGFTTFYYLMKKPFELLDEQEKAEFNKN